MRILFITQRVPYPPNKGEKLRTFHQIEYLLAQGHQITVASPIADEQESRYASEMANTLGVEVLSASLRHSLIGFSHALLSNQSLSVGKFYSPQLQQKIDTRIANGDIGTIICSASSLAQYIWSSSMYKRIQEKMLCMMDFMDLDSDKWQQYSQTAKFPMKLIYQREASLVRKIEQRVVEEFDESFFISQKEIDLFKVAHPHLRAKQILAIGNGIDMDFFTPKPVHEQHELNQYLFVGVMDYKPNIEAVLWFVEYVWPSILRKTPTAKLVIAGMSPSPAIQDLANQPSIEVTGFVENILPYFHQADVFVAPFLIARGVQNKVLQAMACGLPVITSELGAEGIDAIHGQEMLIANTVTEYLEQIEYLNHQANYQTIANAAIRRISDDYSWEGQLHILANAIKEMPSVSVVITPCSAGVLS